MERIAPSATLEAQIADVLSRGIDGNEQLAELGRLGTRLGLQRAVEDEVAAFLGRARYERVPAATGSRNGSRNKPIQTAEGEIIIAMPQVCGTVERFVSRVIPDVRRVVRTRPLEVLVLWNTERIATELAFCGLAPSGARPIPQNAGDRRLHTRSVRSGYREPAG